MQTLKSPSRPSTHGFLRILSIAFLTALLIVLAGEHRSSPVQAGIKVVEAVPVPRMGTLHVLSIGINAYPKDSNIANLRFAVADAQGVAGAFSTKDVGNAFNKVEVTTLVDSAATLSGIRSAMEHLIEECKPEDVVVFYFAGMGARLKTKPEISATSKTPPDYNFIVFDSTVVPGSDISTAGNSFTAHELSLLLLSIQAQRQIIIIDSSDSTAAFDALSAALNADSVFTLRDTGRRFALFGTEGSGYEVPELNHGLMTYTLLEAMKGGADTDHKGYITEADLEGYMMAHMGYMTIKPGNNQSDYQLSEQLLSYSELRGLCLSTVPKSPGCKTDYGYDPKAKVTEETRGQGPREHLTAQQPVDRGTDYALILAGDTYDHWKRLNNPIYDAQTLQQELIQNFGYAKENIFYRENPTKRDIFELLASLQHRTFNKNDRLFVYVAGHGHMEDSGEGFIVTRETALPAEDPYLDYRLALSRFRSTVDGLPVPHILLVLDVCYGGSFKDHKSSPEYTSESLDTPPSLDALIKTR